MRKSKRILCIENFELPLPMFWLLISANYGELEDNYSKYMLDSWKASGLPDQVIGEEEESIKAGHVSTFLLRLRDSVR